MHLFNCREQGTKEGKISTLLVTFRPRTTSERRISGVVSPCILTTDPGKGGKLEAARSNFGEGGSLAFITGTGLCKFHHSWSQTLCEACHKNDTNWQLLDKEIPSHLLAAVRRRKLVKRVNLLTVVCSSSLFLLMLLWLTLLQWRQIIYIGKLFITQHNP